ncbi:MAG: serine protease [Byssovorax sp.]
MLHAEAIHAAQRGLWAGVFHRMNRARNLIVKRLRAPLLLVMAPETEALFAEAAPDFWSGRSGVYRVAHIPEPTRLVGDDMFYDVSSFVDVLSAHASRVCRVDSGGTRRGYATGFLVGPDVVLTTYNIMQEVIEHPAQISAVRLRFGYQRDRDGKINAGTEYHLATDWLIDVSPYDTLDDTLAPNRRPGDELGYALLRVADSPGSSLSSPGGTQPRGWIPLPSAAALEPGAPLFMLHHPSGGPLKLSLNTQSVLDVSTSETIVRYTTNTLAGSGGAPCFDAHWNLVAMHQGSGSNDNDDWHNEGIHITAIRKLLQARGKLALIEQHARVAPFVSPPGKR